MKTIGLIGGLSPQSTAQYYLALCDGVRERFGGLNAPEILISSVNQEEILSLRNQNRWAEVGDILAARARALEAAGTDFVLIACNSVHHVADTVEKALNVPFLHIADATAHAISRAGLETVGLLGTRFTMEMDFYHDRLARYGIAAILPEKQDRAAINRIIFEELCKGQVRPDSRDTYIRVARDMETQGAQGLILGCTEIGMLIGQKDFAGDCSFPVFDTTLLHIAAALDLALRGETRRGAAA